jgi:FixJ family two-component response regulator
MPAPCGRRAVLISEWTPEAGLVKEPLISIIDDDESVREAIKGLMKSWGFTAEAFPSAVDFLASSHFRDTSCLIADVQMPGMTGVELHRHLLESGYAIPAVLITAYPDDRVRHSALKNGVTCYLSKPFDEDALMRCVRSALEQAKPGKQHS